eukprot:6496730-Ditylum_brightwellii.AAC.1
MIQLELRLLVSQAVKDKGIFKNLDVKQAFCQSTIPKNEQYILKSPLQCLLTPTNTYLLLFKTFYGLKRSPYHWYIKGKKIILDLGLKQCPNAPCLFYGEVIPNQPHLYVELYADDIIYYSTDRAIKKHFKKQITTKVTK